MKIGNTHNDASRDLDPAGTKVDIHGPSGAIKGNHPGKGPTPKVKGEKPAQKTKLTQRMALRAKIKSTQGGVTGSKSVHNLNGMM